MLVGIYTLGCKVNIYESEFVTNILIKSGYKIVPFDSKADIYIINTCTVTNTSDSKSRKMINKAKKRKNSIVIVMGCFSQIKDIDADIVIGNKDKSNIVSIIDEYLSNRDKIKKIYDLKKEEFECMEIDKFTNHTRAFVKIQDGCDAYCSYCIIPYVRGNIRSKKEEAVIKEVTTLVNIGYKEIVLTGIHTGKYGKDINTNLSSLLNKLVTIPNIYKIRISSIEINEITDDILNLMKNNNIIARHLHIPLQSGSDKILKLMNRKYDTSYYKKRIGEIRKNIPDISITTDLIVGFPYETEEDFNCTLDFFNKIKFTKVHVFPFSKRDNTKAADMLNQVDNGIKKIRVKKVIDISNELENKYSKKHINEIVEVLIEESKDGCWIGHTSNYLKILVRDRLNINEVYNVKIIEYKGDKLYGKVI